MSIPQEILNEFNKKYFKKNNQYYKLSELNIAFKYLKIYPLGGGFQTTIKLDDYFLNKWREGEYVFTDEMPVVMETGKFGFDCWNKEYIKGWHNPFERWNGWRVPWLTIEGIRQFNKMQDKYFKKKDNPPCFEILNEGMKNIKTKVIYKDPQGDEPYEIEPRIFNLGGWDQTPLYDVGLGLTWDMYDDEGEIA